MNKNLEEEQEKIKKLTTQLIKQEVDEHDIAAVLSRWTGIPAEKLQASETEKLLTMEDILKNESLAKMKRLLKLPMQFKCIAPDLPILIGQLVHFYF